MNKRRILIFIIPLALLAMALSVGSILFLRLFILSTLIVTASYFWAKLSLKNLDVLIADPPESPQVGDHFQRAVTIFNRGSLPRWWIELADQADIPGRHDPALININGHSSFSWQTNFTCAKRGRYHVGPVALTVADPFGIFSKRRTMGETREITVYPATVKLPLFKYNSFSDFSYGSGYQSLSRISPNASSVREFTSGDSLHQIHWRSSARTGKLMVKMFDADRSPHISKNVWITLDMNLTAHSGSGVESSDEYGITIAASLAQAYLESGMQVGLVASDKELSMVTPGKGEEQVRRMLEPLALMSCGDTALNAAVTQNLDHFRDNPMVIIIATTSSGSLVDTIRRLRNRVDSVVVVLLDAGSFGGQPASPSLPRMLTMAGAQVYSVRRGDDLAKTLSNEINQRYPVEV